MPLLEYSGGFTASRDNVDPHSWRHVYNPLVDIRTLLNTTGLDHQNVQAQGLRPTNVMMRDELKEGLVRVTGGAGTALAAGTLIHLTYPTTDPGGSGNVIGCVKAVATAPGSSPRYADAYVPDAISAGASGLAYRMYYEASADDTSGNSTYDHVYLSTTAGEYTLSAPAAGNVIQIVGTVMTSAATGRIIFKLPGYVVAWSLADEA